MVNNVEIFGRLIITGRFHVKSPEKKRMGKIFSFLWTNIKVYIHLRYLKPFLPLYTRFWKNGGYFWKFTFCPKLCKFNVLIFTVHSFIFHLSIYLVKMMYILHIFRFFCKHYILFSLGHFFSPNFVIWAIWATKGAPHLGFLLHLPKFNIPW